MIYIKLSDMDFYDDAVVLVKSFYPRAEVAQFKEDTDILKSDDILIVPEVPDTSGRLKKDVHEEFKKNLYLKLGTQLNKNLPWGYLTGVRPSKIAYTMLENGVEDEEILNEFTQKHFVSQKKADLALQVAKTEKTILDKMDYKNGYSLYIGIPFCPTTCLYCSFTSYSLAAYKSKVDIYLDALIKELAYVSKAMKGRRLDTVYFGGGTPTTLSAEQLDRLLSMLEQYFDIENVKELTGQNMCFFRPPYGDYNNLLIQTATECGYLSIQWDIDSLDWKDYGVQSIIDRTALNPELSNGSIILMHNGAKYTKDALETVISTLQSKGYEFVTLSELVYKDHFHMDPSGKQIPD